MDIDCLNQLIEKLDAVNDVSNPPWGLLLMQSIKDLINQLEGLTDITKRLSELEDIKAASENITVKLESENARFNEKLMKLHKRADNQRRPKKTLHRKIVIKICTEIFSTFNPLVGIINIFM